MDTQKEIDSMLESGMARISIIDLNNWLGDIGYRINEAEGAPGRIAAYPL